MEINQDYREMTIERWIPSVIVVALIITLLWMWHSRDVIAEERDRVQESLEECQSNYEWDDPETKALWDSL